MKQDSKKSRKRKFFSAAAVIVCMLAAGICYSCRGAAVQEDRSVWQLEPAASKGEAGQERDRLESEEEEFTGAAWETEDFEAETAKEELSESGDAQKNNGCEDLGQDFGNQEASDGQKSGYKAPDLWVHVCGCVNAPGLYSLAEGSRIWDAIEAAGGFSANACTDWLNLAQPIEDGMKVEAPDLAQAKQWEAQGRDAALPGTGSNGPPAGPKGSGKGLQGKVNLNTASLEELMTLRGIGKSKAEDIIHYRETFGRFQAIEDIMNVSGIKDAAFEKIKDSITV